MRRLHVFVAVAVLCLSFTGSSQAMDGTGLQVSVAGDTVGSFGTNGPNGATDRIDVREAEFLFVAPIDHLFDGQMSFAAHYEAGFLGVELHELFVETTKLVPRSRIRLGQYFLQYGRLNQIHRHDWPFITTPKIQQTYFDAEGVLDTGIQYSYLLPLPIYLDLTVGVTNGWNFGHSHTQGIKPLFPTHYAHLVSYFDLPGSPGTGIQTGLSYVGRRDSTNTFTGTYGMDVVAKIRDGAILQWLFQGEFWYRSASPNAGTAANSYGFYFFPQYYVGSQLYLGTRLDYFTNTSLTDAFGASFSNYYLGIEPQLTWKPSEFSTFRVAYSWRGQNNQGTFVNNDRQILFQAVFIIGSHPAHAF